MKNLPQKIFLQVDADGELPEDFSELEVVTWCEERIHETDVEYVLISESATFTCDIDKDCKDPSLFPKCGSCVYLSKKE